MTIERVKCFKSVNDLNFIECDSLKEGDLTYFKEWVIHFYRIKKFVKLYNIKSMLNH